MAILRSGILGRASGKVAGVVGAHWKDRSYIREYVIPSNPNTTPQQAQRTLMRGCVSFCKALVGPVFNKYVDKFQKSMSGFNYFISQNIKKMDDENPFPEMFLTWGKLWGILPASCAMSQGGLITVSWVASLGNNGALTDMVYAAVLDGSTGIWRFPAAEVARSALAITIQCPSGESPDFFQVYIWAAKYSLTSPTLLEMVSNSAYSATT